MNSESRAGAAPRQEATSKTRRTAMTLVEVMVSILIISMFATSAISLMVQNQKQTLANFYRLEAFRLAQTIAEHAMQLPYANFNPTAVKTASDAGTATAWTWSDTENATLRSISNGRRDVQFAYPGFTSPVIFTKSIGPVTMLSSGSAKVMQINISWVFAGKNYDLNTNPSDRFYVVLGRNN